ncbi:MAG: hypothetical protein GY873_12695 [Bosea sp.]|nr:hypothetical protein [Bosea sp. (in: a-proteobacteria)]
MIDPLPLLLGGEAGALDGAAHVVAGVAQCVARRLSEVVMSLHERG